MTEVFDFQAAVAETLKEADSPLLGAILLGSSGAGKSRVAGSFGVKTLYVYGSGEDHGYQSAKAHPGADVIPMCFDRAKGENLSADAAYNRLLAILRAEDQIKASGCKAIVVDSLNELENVIRNTTEFKVACTTKTGDHNSFAEGNITIDMLRRVFVELKHLQRRLQLHYAVTCILDVKAVSNFGDIEEAAPKLQGFSVAADVVRQFGDILVVGRMEKNEVVKHKFQFGTMLVKASKDQKGLLKKTLNFAPRINGAKRDVPPLMEADLQEVLKLKLSPEV